MKRCIFAEGLFLNSGATLDITFERLSAHAGADFDALYAIYCEAIPASERKQRGALEAMTLDPSYTILVGKLNHHVVAFSILYMFADPPFALLEYMAVDEAFRGRGIGSEMFRESTRIAGAQGVARLVLEVDSDREDSTDRAQRIKRIDFYRRLGCRRLGGVDYILPLDTGVAPPLMDLMAWEDEFPIALGRGEVTLIVRKIYIEVYGCTEGDPRIARMTDGIPERVYLGE